MKNKLVTEGGMNALPKDRKMSKLTQVDKKMVGLHGGVRELLHCQTMIKDQSFLNSRILKQKYKLV